MLRSLRRINPLVAAVVFAAFMTPSIAAGQDTVRGYWDFFDNKCRPCTGELESNPFCTCQAKAEETAMMARTATIH